MRKKVIIIGAGLAGLSTGIYLQKAGIKTRIFELAPHAGGMCAAWQRNGYRFDGCIQWMVGTKRDEPIYNIYKEVGALTDDTVIYNTDSIDIESRGVVYNVPLKAELFRKLLHTLSPRDTQFIDAFCDDVDMVRQSALMIGLPSELKTIVETLKKSRGFLRIAIKYRNKTVSQVVNNFKSDIIREIMKRLMPEAFSALALFLMLGTRLGGNAGYPLDGADGVVRRMEEKYKALGGVISFNSRVDDIIVVGGKAVGVRSNGVSYKSDGVVAACDARYTLKKMLRGKYKHPQLDGMLIKARLFDPIAIVS
ncbi:MAG: NAD(P)/FAD-dependent oxidoreductase, partial [Clostridiales bacterium]|nr:NAD(P)/FAD-dependent oxidoreductase [Clostridiales bacterium]